MEDVIKKHERYSAAVQLHNQEFRTLGERTTAFLIVQSILVAAIVHVIISESSVLPYAFIGVVSGIIFIGALYCLLQYKAGRMGSQAAFRWRRYMLYIEKKKEKRKAPWEWFYEQCKQPKIEDWEKPSTGKKTSEAKLLYKLPWPYTWLASPAIFSSVWCGAAVYIIYRLLWASDPIKLSLEKLSNDPSLQYLVNPLIGFTLAATTFALVIFLLLVIRAIKWWCRASDL